MKAFIIDRYGRKEKLHLREIADPVIRENEVLVQVYSAGVNLLDSKIKNGEFKIFLPYKMPLVLGHDVAGVITKTGSNVRRFKVGDEVYARPSDLRIGGFAQLVAIDEADLALKPKKLTMEEAASIPLVSLTAWQALVERADLKKGQKIFIQAGSGGVGTIAIQLAKYIGASVATTTSTTNVEWVKALGADTVIDYKTEDFEAILRDYDVVLNSQDTRTLEKSLRVLKPGGKLISISGPPDTDFAKQIRMGWPLKMVMWFLSFGVRRKARRQHVNYSFLFMRAEGSQLSKITALIDSGIINPVIDKVFPFGKTEEALSYVESGHAKGKVVIKVN